MKIKNAWIHLFLADGSYEKNGGHMLRARIAFDYRKDHGAPLAVDVNTLIKFRHCVINWLVQKEKLEKVLIAIFN